MKLKYLFGAMLSAILFTGCSNDIEPAGQLGNMGLSTTYAIIPAEGGAAKIDITASSEWKVTNIAVDEVTGKQVLAKDGEPIRDKNGNATEAWFTLSQLSGTPDAEGQTFKTELTVAAGAVDGGREYELQLSVGGNTQIIMVRQGSMEAVMASCAEVIAGADGKTYKVKGICTAIANTTYGNWYLNDGTGEIYIYGTLDADGAPKNFASLGIEVGDEVELEGPKTTYGTTVELVDVTVTKITKSLIKVVSPEAEISKDGGELAVKVAYKGKGAYADIPADVQEWVRYKTTEFIAGVPSKLEQNPADTAVFKFTVEPNVAGARTGKISFNSGNGSNTSNIDYTFTQGGAILEVPIADFNAAEVGETIYRLTGVVSKVVDEAKGNFYIKDYSADTYVYKLSGFADAGVKVGDIVTLTGKRDQYGETIEMASAAIEKVIPVNPISIVDFLAKEPNPNDYYMVTGTISSIANATYGNLYLTDENGTELYVYGCYPGYGASGDNRKGFLATANIEVGDKLTMIGYRYTHTDGTKQLSGGIYFSHEKAQ